MPECYNALTKNMFIKIQVFMVPEPDYSIILCLFPQK